MASLARGRSGTLLGAPFFMMLSPHAYLLHQVSLRDSKIKLAAARALQPLHEAADQAQVADNNAFSCALPLHQLCPKLDHAYVCSFGPLLTQVPTA